MRFVWLSRLVFVIVISSPFCFTPAAHAEIEYGLSDEALLDRIQEATFKFFAAETHPRTGLVKDRANNFRRTGAGAPASIAATGFGLSAFPVGVERGWMDYSTAFELTRRTLEFFLNKAGHEHGFFYHFLKSDTGERARKSELSSIDTALLIAGALFAMEYFKDPVITDLVTQLYERVDWQWMLNGGETLSMAWSPETGFSKHRWDHYDESMILYLLAIASPTHPIPADSWNKRTRPVGSYAGYRVIQIPPLFTHQYSHIWVDFRDKNDGFADYFVNSVNATLANRQFCIDQSSRYASYGPNSWGLTASDGPFGYKAYGAPPGWSTHDGTVAPTGCGSSIVFTPEESIACLRHFYEELGDRLWGRYGFADAFNLDKDWVATDVIGIDQGALLLMIENYRSELIWKTMAGNEIINRGMDAVGFVPGTKEVPWTPTPSFAAAYLPDGLKIDGYLKDWPNGKPLILDQTFKENGDFKDEKDLMAEVRFAWSDEALYFFVKVTDDSLLLRKTGRNIWMDDAVELFIDPQGDGLYWNDASDFQIGFRPEQESEAVLTWSWFQGGEDPSEKGMVASRGFADESGYIIEGAIRWRYLDITPGENNELRLSIAVHDIDRDRTEGKFQWFFRPEGDLQRFSLGKVILGSEGSLGPIGQGTGGGE